jgi:glucose 1-dehydrogenase
VAETLAGQVVLVTGAGTGIGQGVAEEMGRRGAAVVVNYHASDEGAQETARRVTAAGGEALVYRADVSCSAEVAAMVDAACARFGRLDVLVNNAARQFNLGLLDYDDQHFDELMDTNLLGYWLMIRAVTPVMKAQGGGVVINIGSVHAKRPTDFDPVYAMSKGGIKMLTREAAIELAPYNIRVNAIEPGAVRVGTKSGNPRPIVPPGTPPPSRPRKSRFPLGRVGLPSDVAWLVACLADPAGAFVTGAAIRADGGSMLL